MAGNFEHQDKGVVDLKIAAMALTWNNPVGEDLLPWLQQVKSAGYDGVTGFADLLCGPFLNRPHAFKDILVSNGLELCAVDFQLNTDFEFYQRLFEFMQAMDCRLFVCIDPASSRKDYAFYGDLINRVAELSFNYGVHTHYHNHTNAVGETFTDMKRLIEQLDLRCVSLMLDTGHATKDFNEFPYQDRAIRFLDRYWDNLHYLELKDWNERTDLNTPLGEGYADFSRIFGLMKNRGYSGWVTVEQNGNDGLSLGRSPYACAEISRALIREHLHI